MGRRTEPALRLAERMLGGLIRKEDVVLRVVEVEAYGDRRDSASHARFGRTRRTWPMFESEGRVYVYLCYGIHWMVNVAAGEGGRGAAVLIRGAELVHGEVLVRERRGQDPNRPGVLGGPGKVGQALGASGADNGAWLGREVWSFQFRTIEAGLIQRGPRVGIGYAVERDRRRPWRLWLNSAQVSRIRPVDGLGTGLR